MTPSTVSEPRKFTRCAMPPIGRRLGAADAARAEVVQLVGQLAERIVGRARQVLEDAALDVPGQRRDRQRIPEPHQLRLEPARRSRARARRSIRPSSARCAPAPPSLRARRGSRTGSRPSRSRAMIRQPSSGKGRPCAAKNAAASLTSASVTALRQVFFEQVLQAEEHRLAVEPAAALEVARAGASCPAGTAGSATPCTSRCGG